MSPFVQERLNLTGEQKTQLETLQKEIEGKLANILTEDQKNQLKEMQSGFGPGRGGRGPAVRLITGQAMIPTDFKPADDVCPEGVVDGARQPKQL